MRMFTDAQAGAFAVKALVAAAGLLLLACYHASIEHPLSYWLAYLWAALAGLLVSSAGWVLRDEARDWRVPRLSPPLRARYALAQALMALTMALMAMANFWSALNAPVGLPVLFAWVDASFPYAVLAIINAVTVGYLVPGAIRAAAGWAA
jgi:hypothetical protein